MHIVEDRVSETVCSKAIPDQRSQKEHKVPASFGPVTQNPPAQLDGRILPNNPDKSCGLETLLTAVTGG